MFVLYSAVSQPSASTSPLVSVELPAPGPAIGPAHAPPFVPAHVPAIVPAHGPIIVPAHAPVPVPVPVPIPAHEPPAAHIMHPSLAPTTTQGPASAGSGGQKGRPGPERLKDPVIVQPESTYVK